MSGFESLSSALRIPTAFVAKGVAAIGRVWTARRNRHVVIGLLDFDDHMLRDIGLTRGDVAASLTLPAGGDPSTRLRILAVERRAAARAQRLEIREALRVEAFAPNPVEAPRSLV